MLHGRVMAATRCALRAPTIYQGPSRATAGASCVRLRRSPRAAKIPPFPSETTVPSAAPLLDTRLNGLAPDRHGKVRDIFDLGDALLLVATDRISAFDYVLGSRHPRQGQGAHAAVGVLVRAHGAASSPTTCSAPTWRDLPGQPFCPHAELLPGRSMLVRKTHAAADRVRGARLSVGIRLEGIPGDRRRSAASRCPPGLRESDRLPAADLHARPPRPSTGHDVNISEAEAGSARRRGRSSPQAARPDAGALRRRGARTPSRAASSWPTPSSSSALTDTGELLLIDEVMTPDSSRYWPADQYAPGRAAAELRQAVRARLPRADSLEQAAAGAVAARRRRRRRRATSTSKRTAA